MDMFFQDDTPSVIYSIKAVALRWLGCSLIKRRKVNRSGHLLTISDRLAFQTVMLWTVAIRKRLHMY